MQTVNILNRLALPTVLAVATLSSTGTAFAAVLKPTGITVSTLPGTNDSTNPYTDDVVLDSLTFDGATFSSGDSFRAINRFEVIEGRSGINAEWGDNDNGSDGDDNPFVKAGLNPADQESTNPLIQNAGLLNTFNTLSLTEMSDGEGGGLTSFRVGFAASLVDNDNGVDTTPELVFFERGLNDVFSIQLIIGGDFDTPIFSDSLTIDSGDFWATGVFVDTVEIAKSQEIGVGGFDLNDFGLSNGEHVFGFELTTTDGPDLNGFFLSAESPDDFGPGLAPPSAVPVPAGLPLLLSALAGFGILGQRRKAARASQA